MGTTRDAPAGPRKGTRRLVRAIVCAYTRDELPASWVQVFRRFERTVERARLRVRVRLEPLEELPESFEVIVVAPELAERARTLAPDAHLLTATRQDAANVSAALIRELAEGRSLYADGTVAGEPRIVVHRGPTIL